jgi:glycosyltransferase involved in cell wall biosynthesis
MKFLFADFALPYLLKDADFPVGGWAVELKAWLTALAAEGHRAGVLTWKGANDYVGPQSLCDLVETYDPKKGIRVLKYAYSYIPAMIEASRRYAPDVIVQACAELQTGTLAFAAGRIGVPFVHRIVSDPDADDRYRERLPWFSQVSYRYGLDRAAAILCQNAYQEQSLRARYPDKIFAVIRNPYDAPREPVRPREGRSYIAWLGAFRREKGLPLLLEVARALPSVPFRVGGMAPKNADPETLAAIAGLEAQPNVELAGYVKRPAIHDFLSGAIAVINTSSFEGFSNVFLEAFGAGTPVVAQRSVDPDLVITRERLGLTTDSPAGLADAVREIVGMDPAEYMEFAGRARRYVEVNHAGALRVREMVAALSPLVAAAGGGAETNRLGIGKA